MENVVVVGNKTCFFFYTTNCYNINGVMFSQIVCIVVDFGDVEIKFHKIKFR